MMVGVKAKYTAAHRQTGQTCTADEAERHKTRTKVDYALVACLQNHWEDLTLEDTCAAPGAEPVLAGIGDKDGADYY